jgi:hypothetical protein
MTVAHRGYCEDFQQPTTPFQSSPFYGKYSKEGGTTDTSVPYNQSYLYNGGTQPQTNQPGKKKKSKSYDPRLYEAPPQPAPQTQPPPATTTPTTGNGNGNGNGNAPAGTDGGGAAPPGTTVQQTQG